MTRYGRFCLIMFIYHCFRANSATGEWYHVAFAIIFALVFVILGDKDA